MLKKIISLFKGRQKTIVPVGQATGTLRSGSASPLIGFDFESIAGSSKDDGRVIEGWKRGADGEIINFHHDRLTDGPWPPKRQTKSRLVFL